MPAEIAVTGCLMRSPHRSLEGVVRFVPERMWVLDQGIPWACLAPQVHLLDGRFIVRLTPTDADSVPWYYQVQTWSGEAWRIRYRIQVLSVRSHYTLKELVDEHHAKG